MNNSQKFGIAVVAGLTIALTVDTVKGIRTLRKATREIEANTASDIEAIRAAAVIVRDRIQRGEYKGERFKLSTIMNDYEFEQIVQFNQR